MRMLSSRPLSASLPVVMSALALAVVIGHAAIYGVIHEPDEGAAAHIFQILMVAQIPFLGYFIYKWVSRSPRQFSSVLALLAALWASAFAAVKLLT